jgi:hypothetical protein
MARNKQYNEQEVIEKAMSLFWRNGYQNTSVRMLERKWALINFLFMQVWKQTWRFRRKLDVIKRKYILFSKNYKMEKME